MQCIYIFIQYIHRQLHKTSILTQFYKGNCLPYVRLLSPRVCLLICFHRALQTTQNKLSPQNSKPHAQIPFPYKVAYSQNAIAQVMDISKFFILPLGNLQDRVWIYLKIQTQGEQPQVGDTRQEEEWQISYTEGPSAHLRSPVLQESTTIYFRNGGEIWVDSFDRQLPQPKAAF